ncbi:flavoprotein [Amycolatopsis sp. NPDC049868]|uniref:flavoprotein n=1 Tax=Amycolatopsis sp. NPDC049868 TaxID=3363934 RepID=UPI0037B12C42
MPDRVVYLIGSAAPPVRDLGTLITHLHRAGWRVCVFVTPTAASWVDVDALVAQTGFPVRTGQPGGEPGILPDPDLILACPVTFNTVNKWAAGISDNSALGLLNETFGFMVPTYAMPYAKSTLAAHPAFAESLSRLRSWGVNILPNELVQPTEKKDPFVWKHLTDALPAMDPRGGFGKPDTGA